MESILMGSILFWGAFFGEHFMGSIWRGAFVWRASDPKWSKVALCLNQPQTELLGLLCIGATLDMGLLSAWDYFRHGATFYLGLLSTWATLDMGLLSTWGYFLPRAPFYLGLL